MAAPATTPEARLEAVLPTWLDARVPGSGAPWLQRLRQEAARRLRDEGLPGPKEEAWRFTPLRRLTEAVWTLTDAGEAPSLAPLFPETEATTAHLVDGRFHRVAGAELPEGVVLRSLAEVLEADPARIEGDLGSAAGEGAFDALNTALFEDGVVLDVPAGARPARPIVIVHHATGGDRIVFPRILVRLGEAAEATVVEAFFGEGRALVCATTEVLLGTDARLTHVRLQEEATEGGHEVASLTFRHGAGSRLDCRVVALGGELCRLDLKSLLVEEGAEALLEGLYYVKGTQHVDHHVVADHVAPHCSSRQRFKGIVDDEAHAVFDGVTYVRRGAQQSSGHQENRNLLLSSDAVVHTKPHLEIDADDVSASHGATVGQLEEEQLFYLLSRGIERKVAEVLLMFAFAREIIEGLPHEVLRRRLGEELLARLPDGDRLEELIP